MTASFSFIRCKAPGQHTTAKKSAVQEQDHVWISIRTRYCMPIVCLFHELFPSLTRGDSSRHLLSKYSRIRSTSGVSKAFQSSRSGCRPLQSAFAPKQFSKCECSAHVSFGFASVEQKASAWSEWTLRVHRLQSAGYRRFCQLQRRLHTKGAVKKIKKEKRKEKRKK